MRMRQKRRKIAEWYTWRLQQGKSFEKRWSNQYKAEFEAGLKRMHEYMERTRPQFESLMQRYNPSAS